MKILFRIPHPYIYACVLKLNDNYLLKVQLGAFEQIIRFPEEQISDPAVLGSILENEAWMEIIKNNFLQLKNLREEFLSVCSNSEQGREAI